MQCSVFIATSLDGYIARANGGVDWLSLVERAGEDYGYRAFFDSVDTIIVGRSTYELALTFNGWPYAGKRCVVLTHAALTAVHQEVFYSGSAEALVQELSASGAKHAYVDGGAVIQQFLAAKLIDNMTLSIIPVLLGEGIRLFGKTEHDVSLQLRETRGFDSGLVQLRYALARA